MLKFRTGLQTGRNTEIMVKVTKTCTSIRKGGGTEIFHQRGHRGDMHQNAVASSSVLRRLQPLPPNTKCNPCSNCRRERQMKHLLGQMKRYGRRGWSLSIRFLLNTLTSEFITSTWKPAGRCGPSFCRANGFQSTWQTNPDSFSRGPIQFGFQDDVQVYRFDQNGTLEGSGSMIYTEDGHVFTGMTSWKIGQRSSCLSKEVLCGKVVMSEQNIRTDVVPIGEVFFFDILDGGLESGLFEILPFNDIISGAWGQKE